MGFQKKLVIWHILDTEVIKVTHMHMRKIWNIVK